MRRDDRAPHDRLKSKRKRRASGAIARTGAVARGRARRPAPIGDDRPGAIRLQKLLSMAGVASRRTAEVLIAEGRVAVNGAVVVTLGAKAVPDVDDVKVDGRRVRPATRARYILLNKPRGYVTTRTRSRRAGARCSICSAGVREYVYPVGRLDYDSEGLLLLTSDGDLAARLTHPRHEVPRVYEAIVAGAPERRRDRRAAARGLPRWPADRPKPSVTRGATIGKGRQQTTKLVITLFEGRNRQVRRDVRQHRPSGAHAAARQHGPADAARSRRGRLARPDGRSEVAALRDY